MCGICGRFAVAPTPPSMPLWERLTDAMWRRGPDDRGLLVDDRCVLGARRLSVMDRTDCGHLPIRSECGQYRLAFNGELYNFRELRSTLDKAGFRFRSSGDSEVVLYALQHWGVAALDRFNGMFALAFHDQRSQSLTLARDHVGIKPLYVLEDDRGVVFASEYEQIMAHPWARDRAVDTEAVAMYLRLGFIPAPRGYLVGAGMLAPGSWLRIDAGGHRTRGRYFRFEPSERSEPVDQDEVETTIRAAVARQAVSDAPLGSLLSGGVDSPLVAGYLVDDRGPRTPTFSIGMEVAALDESADAARYAATIGSAHHTATLRVADVPRLLDEAMAATHEPLADEGILPALLVSELAREQVTVALSGEGGDELFWGYYPRQSAMLAPCAELGAHSGHSYLSYFTEFTRPQFTACFPGLDWWPDGEPGYEFDARDPVGLAHALRRSELAAYLPFILLKADRASMHHSLELRVPLLDREVITLAQGLRAADCLDLARGVGKVPLRRALHRRVGYTTAGKRGFTAPIDTWLRTVLREPVASSLDSLAGLESIEVDRVALRALFDGHQRGEHNSGMALWRLLCLDRWIARQRQDAGTQAVPVGC